MMSKSFILTKMLVNFIAVFSCVFAATEEYVTNLKIDVISLVWGRDFTDTYLKVSLPLQLCPGNIGSLPPNSARYRIFTTRIDWEYMQSHPSMKKLQEMIFVDFVEISSPPQGLDPYGKLIECQNRAIQDASQDKRAIIFLPPDCLISNRTFQTIVKNAMEGYRVILTSSFDVKKEVIAPLLEHGYLAESLYHNRDIYDYGLDSRQLVKLVLPYLSPLFEAYIHKNEQIGAEPSYIIWELDKENLLSFGFSCHPIFVWPERYETCEELYDYRFPSIACPSQQWKVIQDSDEIALFHLTDYRYRRVLSLSKVPFNSSFIADFWRPGATPHYWFFSEKLVYTHSSDYRQEWKPIEEEAEEFLQEVIQKR